MENRTEQKPLDFYERLPFYGMLAAAGGLCGGYGIVSCGHSFPLAQTGNIISIWTLLTSGDGIGALTHFLMLLIFASGLSVTVRLPKWLGSKRGSRFTFGITLLLEAVCAGTGLLLPESLPGILRVFPFFFLSGLQYNTFKNCEGITVSTLFCTNSVRQLTLGFWDWRDGGGRTALYRMRIFGTVLICYSTGVLISCLGTGIGRWILLPAFVEYLVLATGRLIKK